MHDPRLGYAPRPGFSGVGATGWSVNIDTDGLRSCGEFHGTGGDRPVLAVGDSYTFGEEVGDTETWPAQLQCLSGRQVLNGGVSGYGFDQVVLRAEQLMDEHKPSIVIVGFIADDIRRTEMRRLWWRDKPWFAIESDRFVLAGAPVPERRPLAPRRVGQRLERILIELPAPLQQFFRYHIRRHAVGQGGRIALHLVERLAKLERRHECPVVLLAQYHPNVWGDREFAAEERRTVQQVLDHARHLGLATIDTFARFAMEPMAASLYINSHLGARGNLMIASLLAARLSELQAGPQR